ncbi:hypothetical protein [uncultured Haemophilus sp.]|uniref:hypothetical protein n=1 Tax=uncultured Haemophilus sp. TaxID=237779 RepID=UPI00258B3787|nr:hypothetical protein [uncultured Haemophilus sp.]
MKQTFKDIDWLITSTFKFILALTLIVGVVLGVAYFIENIKTGNAKGVLICFMPILFIIAHLLDKYWWRNTKKYQELMNKENK